MTRGRARRKHGACARETACREDTRRRNGALPALAAGGGDAFGRGVAALDAGKPRVARVEFMNAIAAAPNDPQPHLMQARTFLVLEDGVAAEAEVAHARALGAPDKDLRHMLAEALLLQGKPEQALAAAEGVSRFPGATLRMRGRAHQALGRTAEATLAFDEALRIAPRDHRLWVDVARFRLQMGERAGAIALQTRQRIAGVVENMSGLVLPDGTTMQIFGEGGGKQVAESLSRSVGADVPLLGQVPLDPRLREAGDNGTPLVLEAPDSPAAVVLNDIAKRLSTRARGLAGKLLSVSPA